MNLTSLNSKAFPFFQQNKLHSRFPFSLTIGNTQQVRSVNCSFQTIIQVKMKLSLKITFNIINDYRCYWGGCPKDFRLSTAIHSKGLLNGFNKLNYEHTECHFVFAQWFFVCGLTDNTLQANTYAKVQIKSHGIKWIFPFNYLLLSSFYGYFWQMNILNIQSNSVITNSRGPEYVRYNRETL